MAWLEHRLRIFSASSVAGIGTPSAGANRFESAGNHWWPCVCVTQGDDCPKDSLKNIVHDIWRPNLLSHFRGRAGPASWNSYGQRHLPTILCFAARRRWTTGRKKKKKKKKVGRPERNYISMEKMRNRWEPSDGGHNGRPLLKMTITLRCSQRVCAPLLSVYLALTIIIERNVFIPWNAQRGKQPTKDGADCTPQNIDCC